MGSTHFLTRTLPRVRTEMSLQVLWRARFGGMQAGDATRLREIELENGKLKKLLAEAHLHIEALKVGFGVKR